MVEVLFAQSAKTDLLEIWLYIAEEDLVAADKMLDSIAAEANTLSLQPLMGRARPELAHGIRSWPVSKSYNLYYLADAHAITVIRVLHQARDASNIWI